MRPENPALLFEAPTGRRRGPHLPRRGHRSGLVLSLAFLMSLGLGVRPVWAGAASLTFHVTSSTDAPDAMPGDGICADASGQCTLRAAVQEANAQPSGSTITIRAPARTFRLKLGVLSLTTNTISIQGASGGATTIDGRSASQVLNVSSTAAVTLSHLTITGGKAANGGGIENAGKLMVTKSTVTANKATSAGGGMYNHQTGTLALMKSSFSQNVSASDGGGIANNGGTLHLTLGTVSANKAGRAGGGIVSYFGTASIIKSTIANNATSGPNSEGGGGIANGDTTLTVDRSTISGNTTTAGAGGSAIFNVFTASVSSSTITGRCSPPKLESACSA